MGLTNACNVRSLIGRLPCVANLFFVKKEATVGLRDVVPMRACHDHREWRFDLGIVRR